MTDFTVHTLETAPDGSREMLEQSNKAFGMVPNLHAVMAESPQALAAYKSLGDLFTKTSLSKIEQNVVWLAINVEHHCHYCVPAHTAIAKSQGVDDATIDALRSAEPIADPKLQALRAFTLAVVRQRGEASQGDFDKFFAAGFTRQNALDVVVGVAHKTLSNYINHFAHTPVDAAFQKFEWTPPAQAAQ